MKRISNNIENTIIIKNSKFITNLFIVEDIEEVNRYLNLIKDKYRDANHNCYAYVVGNIKKCSDDGEPSGTAGMPMIRVLERKELNNILVIVTRYFGGTTEKDIDKLSLMIEFNFIDGITSDDSEWDIKTIGFHNLCGGLDKNRRQSYSEILWDVIYHALSLIDDEEKLFKSSELAKKVYETINMIECGEDGFSYDLFSNDELQQCITDIYKFMLKDKIEF